MLLRDLTIENYRSFEKYKLDGLARVNLLVGDNNCGKTSVLEALELFCSASPIDSMKGIARRRREFVPSVSERTAGRQIATSATFFHGRGITPGATFEIGSDDSTLVASIEMRGVRRSNHSSDEAVEVLDNRLVLRVDSRRYANPPRQTAVLEPTGAFVANSGYGFVGNRPTPEKAAPPIEYVGPDSSTGGNLSSRWQKVVLQGLKDSVLTAIRVLHPAVVDVNYLSGETTAGSQIALTLKGEQLPWQLGSLGEGSKRIFWIGSALASGRDGIALIDEIDTGLHYSRLSDLWRLVIKTALELDTQVFATTHSLDCIRGLADAVALDESFVGEVTIHRIDRRTDHSIRFGGDELEVVAEQEIEVR